MSRNQDDTPRAGKFTNRELLSKLWPLFRPWITQFATALFLLMVAQALLILGPWLIKRAIDVDIADKDRVGLQRTVLLYLLVQLAHLVTSYGVRNWLESVGQRMMAGLRCQLVDHLVDLPLAFHDRMTPGQLMSRVESDTQALRVLFTTTAVTLLGDALLFIGMFVVMFACSIRLTLLCAVVLPVMGVMTYHFQGQIHPIFVRVRKLNSLVASRLTEFLQAMPVIQAFARERWAIADFQKRNFEKYDTQVGGEWQILLWWNGVRFLQNFAIAIVLGMGGYWSLGGAVSVGTLVMFLAFIRRFFQPLQRLSEQLAMIQKAFASAERLFLLLGEPQTLPAPEKAKPWPNAGCEVVFENVWFRYERHETDAAGDSNEDNASDLAKSPNAVDGDDDWVLRDVSFRVPSRKCFAIVGPTGSGKTTMISLLMRFYDPQRGRILIDGTDIREMEKEELRRRIGVVMQDIYLFWGDLSENMTLGREYSNDAIREAARLTLSDRFIENMPGGFAAELSERGGNLSVGQRQLLSFTRAVLRDPQLMILDEATSAVDPATESAIAEVTERIMRDRTSIVIAHRLSTIRNADHILVLVDGRIEQQGTHDELMDLGGTYRELQSLQQVEAAG